MKPTSSPHKAGFVNIIGSPNVGKSTLMNLLVGERLSIINAKAQTTRHRIKGIVNGEGYQIVFSDTPGVLQPAYKLHDAMNGVVNEAFSDADVIVLVIDVNETKINNDDIFEKIKKTDTPVLIAVNKIDTVDQGNLEKSFIHWKELLPKAKLLPISALNKFNIDTLKQNIVDLLPASPAYYPDDQLTDKPEKFFVSEIIREKILTYYKKEIPYSVEVVVTAFKDLPDILKISVEIYVMRDSQVSILVGHNGVAIKKVGTEARKTLEKFFDKKIFLETFVKVKKDWRDNDKDLKKFGYL